MMKVLFRLLLAAMIGLTIVNIAFSQSRTRQSVNTDWHFTKGDTVTSTDWEAINIPHSFNTHDVLDDEPGYYRGDTWYKKRLFIPGQWKKQRDLYLYFEGVNQVATVYVNGKEAGQHLGGYTAFRVKLNEFLNEEPLSDVVLVKVNNAYNENIPPLTADFTFFGGIYRDVFLESFDRVRFNVDDYGAEGVFITTPEVSDSKAEVNIRCIISNNSPSRDVIVTAQLHGPAGELITSTSKKQRLIAHKNTEIVFQGVEIKQPQLWSPEHPTIYKVVTRILDKRTQVGLDELVNPIGFRWFDFTSDKGFFLNGKPYKIWGTSRHQDFPYLGNALSDEQHVNDVKLLKSMGGNFLRVAHYPQDPVVLQACDKLGLLTSVEIPVVNTITESKEFSENCKTMMVEMIRQNFNHPSVVMWASMNEVLLRPLFKGDSDRQELYSKNVTTLARTLDSLSRVEDPTRKTMMAFHGDFNLYKRTSLIDIPDVAGWNLYQGWYGPDIEGFGKFLDNHHRSFPKKPLLITEYGADGDPRIRSFSPQRFDKSIEYENYYHRVYIKAIADRPFVSGGLVWNLADFNSETRAESMPHINNKGIVDGYRKPKDTYYLYQCYLSDKPFTKIASSVWNTRSGVATSSDGQICVQEVEVFSNLTSSITLMHNGQRVGSTEPENFVAKFSVSFQHGTNELVVLNETNQVLDVAKIDFTLIPRNLSLPGVTFEKLLVNLGDSRYFNDDVGQVWLPEKSYEAGGWGYIGGKAFILPDKSRQPFGTDRNIIGTDYDPLFATQREGIQKFRADVPDGKYELVLHFAELTGGQAKEALAYNLSKTEDKTAQAVRRSFDVVVNGTVIADSLSNENYLIPEKAYSIKSQVLSSNNSGIVIEFVSRIGTPILNAIEIRKIY